MERKDMTLTPSKLDTPIDVMYLIHQALRAEAQHAVQLVDWLEVGGSLQPVVQAFNRWSAALGYHAEAEDQHMTSLLPEAPQARDNEAVHNRLAGILADLQTYLQEAEQQAVTARLQRHLLGRVVALQIAQDDHLEEEEEFVLPLIRARISAEQQVEIARHLLLDPHAPNERWILEWVAQLVTTQEQQWLAKLATRFAVVPLSSGGPGEL
jgi:hemerythrin-like domain-containing protein